MKLTKEIIGQRIKEFRTKLGMKQQDIADILTVPQASISHIENGNGGSYILLIELLSFYSQHFKISKVFEETFEVTPQRKLQFELTEKQLIVHEVEEIEAMLRSKLNNLKLLTDNVKIAG